MVFAEISSAITQSSVSHDTKSFWWFIINLGVDVINS